MLEEAPDVCIELQDLLPDEMLVYAIADTSYGECCIDDVTASHAKANDMIVHFGHSCFSTKSFGKPIVYVLP